MMIIKNKKFTLQVNENCKVESLVLNSNGEECIENSAQVSLFSLTEERPFNNELKLAYPTRRITFEANSVHRDGDRLIIGFELLPFEAVVEIKEGDNYVSFTLVDYVVDSTKASDDFCMDYPPVAQFRLLQLPIKKRENYGEWLNVSHDDKVAVNVLSISPYAIVDSDKRNNYDIMYADAVKGIKLKGCGAALIVSEPSELLDCIECVENDYDLPRGVASRRTPEISHSIYWTMNINPENVDEHITYAKMGGFKLICIYYPAFLKSNSYAKLGDYDVFRESYPNGLEDLKHMIKKINDAGIRVGLHILHTHIGLESSYITPVADHRLNLTQYFTLARGVSETDDTIFVEQNPEGVVEFPECRVLKFDGELINYESYKTEYPYCFKGCTRGHCNTVVTTHNKGTIGGILDISEYVAQSAYIDQRTSLQDEIADKIAEIYSLGFEFVYFDGSEGTNIPYAFYVPYAQYRVYKKLLRQPLFCEGAAKSHFSWHMLSGGNAFDIFPMNVFKQKIAEFPMEEAPRMKNDFTRINFGWWDFNQETQPDIYEYGISKAQSWDCPITVMGYINRFENNPRTNDILEVIRRWEDAREKNLLTQEQKEMLRDPDTEYTLLINEVGEYELVPYYEISVSEKNVDISAFSFERCGKSYAVCWHKTGSGELSLNTSKESVSCEKELGGERIAVGGDTDCTIIPVSGKCYISSNMTIEELRKIF
jgi:hypothetical protein